VCAESVARSVAGYTRIMLSHVALLILGDPTQVPQIRCQQMIRLFAEFDFSIPRSIIPDELDRRFSWGEGSARRVISLLIELEILQSFSKGRPSAGGSSMLVINPKFSWSPRSLADQWQRVQDAQDRAGFVQSPLGL
jgi:hypothetical protein